MKHLGAHSDINGGQLTVGGLDTEHCSSNFNMIPLTSRTYWQFKMSRYVIITLSSLKISKLHDVRHRTSAQTTRASQF